MKIKLPKEARKALGVKKKYVDNEEVDALHDYLDALQEVKAIG